MFRARTARLVAPIRIGLVALAVTLFFSMGASAGPPEMAPVLDGATFPLPNSGAVVGQATLQRTKKGLTVNVWTTGLDEDPSAVYTMWWVIIDLYTGGVCVQWAAGHPVGPNGTGHFAAHTKVGDTSGDTPSWIGCDTGLVDPATALVLVQLRSHGEKIPGEVDDQLSSYAGGGCLDTPPPFDPLDPCTDQQEALFFPPMP
jgi:hypothetical protein